MHKTIDDAAKLGKIENLQSHGNNGIHEKSIFNLVFWSKMMGRHQLFIDLSMVPWRAMVELLAVAVYVLWSS